MSWRLRLAACALWLVGAALAAATGVLALTKSKAGYSAVYAVVALTLVGLAAATWRTIRLAETISVLLLGSQMLGVAGAAWELVRGDETGAKARHLEDLGIDLRLALLGNLIYSAVASAVFVWAWRERRRSRQLGG